MRYPTVIADLSELLNKEGSVSNNGRITLSKEESHHLANVLRINIGGKVIIFCPELNKRYEAKVTNLGREITIEIIRESNPEPYYRSPVYALLFALCKGEKNDLVAEKVCELGVSNLIFWQASRSVTKLRETSDINRKLARWNKIALSAAKQCGTYICTKVEFQRDLMSAINQVDKISAENLIDGRFVCSLAADSKEIKNIEHPISSSVIVVGPEGDLTAEETKILADRGFSSITLGPLILRAETAAISCIAAFNSNFGFIKGNQ